MWVILAFGSAFFAGITSILAKMGVADVNSTLATALRTIVVLFFSWLMVFISGTYVFIDDLKTILFLVLSGISTGASWLCYFKALQLGDINKVTPIDKSSTILTMILAFIIFHETISYTKVIGMIIMSMGTYMMITKKNNVQKSQKGWLFYALLSAFFASLTAILGKVGVSQINSSLGSAIRTIIVLIMAWLIVFIENKQNEIKYIDKKNWLFLILSGTTTGASWLCYYKALQLGPASIVVPIDKLSIVVSVVFAYFIFHEKLSLKSFTGLIMIVIGTLMLLI